MSEAVEEIKRRLDIVDFIKEYIQLKKAGANWKGLCPFHQEKTPSFMVSEERQMWHCFGCGLGGDCFSFLQAIENIDFPEALRILADKTNVSLPQYSPQEKSERTRITELVREAARFFYTELRSSRGRKAFSYLINRGLTEETIKIWKLGCAPDSWDALLQHLQASGYNIGEILKAGLALERGAGSGAYDRFRDRVIFPLSDAHGTIVGFTGRAFSDDQGAKYINTPTTLLYDKSRMVYGLDFAKEAIKKEGKAVLVEGQMDVISSHQASVKNVVGVSGTALTLQQIQLIKRFAKTFILAFDEDQAGSQAALRGIELCWQEEIFLEILTLPKGKDPDACVREDPALWKKAVAEAVPFLDYLFARAIRNFDLTAIQGRKEVSRFLLPFLAKLSDPVERSLWFSKLAELVSVEERILHEAVTKQIKTNQAAPKWNLQKKEPEPLPLNDLSLRFFSIIIAFPELFNEFKDKISKDFFSEPVDALAQKLIYGYTSKDLTSDDIFKHTQDLPEEIARGLYFLKEEFLKLTLEDAKREATRLLAHLRRVFYTRELSEAARKLRTAEEKCDKEAIQTLLEQCQKLVGKIHSN